MGAPEEWSIGVGRQDPQVQLRCRFDDSRVALWKRPEFGSAVASVHGTRRWLVDEGCSGTSGVHSARVCRRLVT